MHAVVASLLLLAVPLAALGSPYGLAEIAYAKAGDIDGAGFLFGAGYRITPLLSVEASYLHGGGRSDPELQGTRSTMRFWTAAGPGVAVVIALPLSNALTVLASGGARRLEAESRVLVTDRSTASTISDESTTTTAWAANGAAGLLYSLRDSAGLRAMFEYQHGVGDLSKILRFSIGAVKRF